MPVGQTVRRLFGRHEARISELYRGLFVNVDAFVATVKGWVPEATNVLEVGCGEGAVTQRLAASYPHAAILGIDITPRLGRLYSGRREGVRFEQTNVQEVAASRPGQFDLIILADVLHHVPEDLRKVLLDSIRTLLAPEGRFVLKEWERTRSPIYWMGYLSDRWITGDRIRYMPRDELACRIQGSFGAGAAVAEARIAPWRNNLATLVAHD